MNEAQADRIIELLEGILETTSVLPEMVTAFGALATMPDMLVKLDGLVEAMTSLPPVIESIKVAPTAPLRKRS